jgi:hypothetical protein
VSTPYENAAADVAASTEVERLPRATVEGVEFTLHGNLGALEMSELARAADLDSTSVEGAAALADLFRAAFGDHVAAGRQEYVRFRRHMRAFDDDTLIGAIATMVEAFSGFPTERRPASPASPSTSTPGSRGDGSPLDAPASRQTVPGVLVVDSEDGAELGQIPQGATVVNIGRAVS